MPPPLPSPPPRDVRLLPSVRLFRFVLLCGGVAICLVFAVIGGHGTWKAIEYERNRHEAVGTNGQLWRGAVIGALIVFVVFGYLDWRIRRERALARTGMATRGTVKEIRVLYGSRGPRGWRVHFEFTSLDGRTRIGSDQAPVTMYAEMPTKGDSVVVLYDHYRPQRNRLLATIRFVDKDSLFQSKTSR